MDIQTQRLRIRPLTPDDALAMHPLFCDEETMRLLGMAPALTTMDETRLRLTHWIDGGHHSAVTLHDGTLIGYIAVRPDAEEHRADTRELGFTLLCEHRHHGYMQETVLAVLRELKQAGVRYVWACCFQENAPSKALIERCGFTFIQEGTYTVHSEGKTYASLEYRIELPQTVL